MYQYVELKISKCYFSNSFHLTSAKLYEDMATMVEYRLLHFLATGQVLKMLWHV